jgi:hypothetical protein
MATPFGNLQQQLVVQAMVAGAPAGDATQPCLLQQQQSPEQDTAGTQQHSQQQLARGQKLCPAADPVTACDAAGVCPHDQHPQQMQADNKQQQQLQQTSQGFLLGPGFWQEVLGSAMLSPGPPSGAFNSMTDDDIRHLLCDALRQAESSARQQQVQQQEKKP